MRVVYWLMSLLFFATVAETMILIVWRGICFFRREGSCKFARCPFRRDYTGMSELSFPGEGCTKCRPTREEMTEVVEELREIAKEYVGNGRE